MVNDSNSSRSDSKVPLRTVLVSVGFLGLVALVFVLGKTTDIINFERVQSALQTVSGSPWGLPALILLFCVAALFGAPQFVLIGLAVAVFGPWLGFAYSWIATLCSGTMTFWIGRLAGAETLRRYGGRRLGRLSAYVGRKAFAASMIVRSVPSGPFLIVNMAFGLSEAKFSRFFAGMALGILPKMVLIAFAGESLYSALRGNPGMAVLSALATLSIWAALAYYARRRMQGLRQSVPFKDAISVDNSADRPE